ncbi:glycosyltransferase family 1 protein [Priestia megaterium]|uniref:glycosyltransferase family 1 protein n=1 Tax=Priestia megaterium TaxID=1404 RepID=UPI0007626A41|nr:glycosyltransferase family 1 protein [Priestia megaterium]KWU59143.1 glycosyl transferase family 1 [Priestia megaterium]
MTNEPIRVLRIMGPVVSGGVDIITMNYYRSIEKEKVQLDFIFDGFHDTPIDQEIKEMGGKIYKVTPYTSSIWKSMKQVYQIVKENNYQIVHSHMNALSVFPLCAAKLAGAKVRIASNHSTATKGETKKTILKYLLRPFAKLFPTHYAACSQHAGYWLFGKKTCDSGEVSFIKNAIDLNKYKFDKDVRNNTRRDLNITDQFVVGHVGRFAYQKNHKFVVEVFEEICKQHSNSVLLLAGNGPLKTEIKNLIEDKGLSDKVKFLGVRKDIHKIMQAFDVFLFPSFYEGLGNVITEAQAVSTVSVVSEGIPDEVRFTEYVVGMNLNQSAKEWAQVVLNYKEEYTRRDTKVDMRKNGYDIELASKKLVDYYMKLNQSI